MSSPPAEPTSASKPAASSSGATNFEFEPPVACVRRVLKAALPSSTNTSKDAIAAFTRGVGIFVIYLTTCANDVARENKRQTITANDVLKAVKELDFGEFTPELKQFLENYRANEKSKKDAKAKAKRSSEDAGNDDDNNSVEGAPAAKKAKTDPPASVEVAEGEQDEIISVPAASEETSPKASAAKDDKKMPASDSQEDSAQEEPQENAIESLPTSAVTGAQGSDETEARPMSE